MKCFYGGKILLKEGLCADKAVITADGIIQDIVAADAVDRYANAERIDLNGNFLLPGFIDIHVHGGGGADFMDGSVSAVTTGSSRLCGRL